MIKQPVWHSGWVDNSVEDWSKYTRISYPYESQIQLKHGKVYNIFEGTWTPVTDGQNFENKQPPNITVDGAGFHNHQITCEDEKSVWNYVNFEDYEWKLSLGNNRWYSENDTGQAFDHFHGKRSTMGYISENDQWPNSGILPSWFEDLKSDSQQPIVLSTKVKETWAQYMMSLHVVRGMAKKDSETWEWE